MYIVFHIPSYNHSLHILSYYYDYLYNWYQGCVTTIWVQGPRHASIVRNFADEDDVPFSFTEWCLWRATSSL